jgi:hypothetical protein
MVLNVNGASFQNFKNLGEMAFLSRTDRVSCQILYSIMISTLCYEHQMHLLLKQLHNFADLIGSVVIYTENSINIFTMNGYVHLSYAQKPDIILNL